MRYTPGMCIAAIALVIWYSVVENGTAWVFPIAIAASAIIDGLCGVRPFWIPEEQIPNKKFYSKK